MALKAALLLALCLFCAGALASAPTSGTGTASASALGSKKKSVTLPAGAATAAVAATATAIPGGKKPVAKAFVYTTVRVYCLCSRGCTFSYLQVFGEPAKAYVVTKSLAAPTPVSGGISVQYAWFYQNLGYYYYVGSTRYDPSMYNRVDLRC